MRVLLMCCATASVMILAAVIALTGHPTMPTPDYGPVRCAISPTVDLSIAPAPTQRDRVSRRIKRFCDAMGADPTPNPTYPALTTWRAAR